MYNIDFLLCTQKIRRQFALGGTIAVDNGDHGVVDV